MANYVRWSNSNVVLTREHLDEVVEYFMTQPAFAFDVESMDGDEPDTRGVPTQNKVVWMALATEGMAVTIPFGHPNGDVLLRKATRKKNKITGKFDPVPAVYNAPPPQLSPSEVFEALRPLFFSDKIKIAHNATFDLISCYKYYGQKIPGPYHDTIVIQWLLNENLKSKGLKDLIERYFAVKYDHENVGRCIEAHPFSKVAHYAYMDAKYTWLLWKRLYPLLESAELSGVFQLEASVLSVLLDMGTAGAPVDVSALEALKKELSEELVRIEADIYRNAGQKFTIGSVPQKQKVLYGPKSEGGQGLKPAKFTDKGAPSTDAESLEEHRGNPLVDSLLEYQTVNKILGTYVLGYLGDGEKKPCRIYDGRIHSDLVQYGTVTGRFSSREPNLQNIPRPEEDPNALGSKIRGLFVAPEGYKMVVADYGQIEMVLLAHFCGHGALFDGIRNGLDPHSATAAVLMGMGVEEFMARKKAGDPAIKAARQVAKGINFAVVYGAGPDKVASMAKITLKEAKRFLEIHQREFPEIYRLKEHIIATCKSRRPPHIRTMSGRKRRLPTIFSDDRGMRGQAERQAVNSLIQGSAADLIKRAMIRLNESLPADMQLILSVHDELVTLTPEHRAEECVALVKEAMLGEGIQSLVSVPLSSDVVVCDRWSEGK